MSPSKLHVSDEVKTPSNAITLVRILLVPVFVAVLLAPWPEWVGLDSLFNDTWKSIIAAGIFIFISCTDWLDGYLARKRNEITDFGKFMDPLADKILVAAALICLVELGDLPTWVVLIILAREFIVSGVRMMAASHGEVIAASMIGKFKTVFQMIAIVLFTIKGSLIVRSMGEPIFNLIYIVSWIFMIIALGLTIASMVDYLVKARDYIGLGKQGKSIGSTIDASAKQLGALVDGPAERCVELAKERGVTLCTAESLTGGMIGEAITSVPGASNVYKGGIVSYVNEVKAGLLGVDRGDLHTYGAVSQKVAEEMASGARQRLHCDIAVSVTGLAGPDGDDYGNPVGTVWIGFCTEDHTHAVRQQFEGDRAQIRRLTVEYALRSVADMIEGMPVSNRG